MHTQVVLVLRWLRHRLDLRTLALQARVSIATAYRYLHEGLNATEGMWAHVKRDLGNLLAGTVDELADSAKRLLKRIQYRPALIDGFRAQIGLALDPQPP